MKQACDPVPELLNFIIWLGMYFAKLVSKQAVYSQVLNWLKSHYDVAAEFPFLFILCPILENQFC